MCTYLALFLQLQRERGYGIRQKESGLLFLILALQ